MGLKGKHDFIASICKHCLGDLKKGHTDLPPAHSLANNLWIGQVPAVLS